MFNHKTLRLSSLLLAVGLLLGLVVTGCSDKDRDGWSEDKTVTFDYMYEVETGGKVSADAKLVEVNALDENGMPLAVGSATLASNKVEDHQNKEDGKYYATTTVKSDVSRVVYNFYHELDGAKVSDGIFTMDVADVQNGQYDATEDEAMELTVAVVNLKDEKQIDPPVNIKVGDGIAVKVFGSDPDAPGELLDVSPYVDIETNQAILQSLDGQPVDPDDYVWVYAAISDGDAYLDVRYQDVSVAGIIVTVSGEKLLLCPAGYDVQDGVLVDENGDPADPKNLPTNIVKSEDDPAFGLGDSYTFVVAYMDADGNVALMSPDDGVFLSDLPSGVATIEDFTMTVANIDNNSGKVFATMENGTDLVQSNVIGFDINQSEPQ